jgi:hypothetical protein
MNANFPHTWREMAQHSCVASHHFSTNIHKFLRWLHHHSECSSEPPVKLYKPCYHSKKSYVISCFLKRLYCDKISIPRTRRCTTRKGTVRPSLSNHARYGISYNLFCNFVITLMLCILLRYALTLLMFPLSLK